MRGDSDKPNAPAFLGRAFRASAREPPVPPRKAVGLTGRRGFPGLPPPRVVVQAG